MRLWRPSPSVTETDNRARFITGDVTRSGVRTALKLFIYSISHVFICFCFLRLTYMLIRVWTPGVHAAVYLMRSCIQDTGLTGGSRLEQSTILGSTSGRAAHRTEAVQLEQAADTLHHPVITLSCRKQQKQQKTTNICDNDHRHSIHEPGDFSDDSAACFTAEDDGDDWWRTAEVPLELITKKIF